MWLCGPSFTGKGTKCAASGWHIAFICEAFASCCGGAAQAMELARAQRIPIKRH